MPIPKTKTSIYPKALLPERGKNAAHKGDFCTRLVRNLEHFDHSPHVWGVGEYDPLPPILNLPPELRQQILYEVLEKHCIKDEREKIKQTGMIPVVCKQFAEDMTEVRKLWDADGRAEQEEYNAERAAMKKLAADMCMGLDSSRQVLVQRNAAIKAHKKAAVKALKKDKKKARGAAHREKSVQRAVEFQEMYAKQGWREKEDPFKKFGARGKAGTHVSF